MKDKYSILISKEQSVNAGGTSFPAQEPIDLFAKGFVDIAESFTHTLKSKITSVPIEDGFSISDNIVDEPVVLKMVLLTGDLHRKRVSGWFDFESSEAFFDYKVAGLTGFAGEGVGDVTQELIEHLTNDTVELKKPEDGFEQLTKLKRDRTLLSVTGVFGHYENMLIEKLVIDESADTGLSLRAVVTMKQIRYAKKAKYIDAGVRVVTAKKAWELLMKLVNEKQAAYLKRVIAEQRKAAYLLKQDVKKVSVMDIYMAHPWGS